MSEIPRHWRMMQKTVPFAFPVIMETADYRVIEIGNGLHVISKIDGSSFQLGEGSEISRISINCKDKKDPAIVQAAGTVYLAPVVVAGD